MKEPLPNMKEQVPRIRKCMRYQRCCRACAKTRASPCSGKNATACVAACQGRVRLEATRTQSSMGVVRSYRGTPVAAVDIAGITCTDREDKIVALSVWLRFAKGPGRAVALRLRPFYRCPFHNRDDERALLGLWREKRGEAEPEDLSGNLIVQLGAVTEEFNRYWYEAIIPVRLSRTCKAICDILGFAGWRRRSTDAWRQAELFSRPSSCCHGHSWKKRLPRSICRSCSTICG